MKPFTFLSVTRKLRVLRRSRQFPLPRDVPSPFDLHRRLDTWQGLLQHKGTATLKAMEHALAEADRQEAAAACDTLLFLVDTQEMAHAIRGFLNNSGSVPQLPTYLVSAWFLADCQHFLVSHPQGHERLHFVTGLKIGGVRTLDRMLTVELEQQSAIHAAGNVTSSARRLMEMDHWGHALHGIFHSHPGLGKEATRPSGTDLATQERHERGGYPLLGAIFVRDGFVRFFTRGHPFVLRVYGEGVSHVEENVYHLSHLSHNPPQAEPVE
jgi:hypothetical protein